MEVFDDVEKLYAWIDAIPLSRCKRNLTRDFSDGGMKLYRGIVKDKVNYLS